MTPEQQAHMLYIKDTFNKKLVEKYRKGAKEHGGLLSEKPIDWLLDQAIDEALDQATYLITLKQLMEEK